MSRGLDSAGYDNDAASSRARAANQPRGRTTIREPTADPDAMDVDDNPHKALARAKSRARSTPATNRRLDGITTFSNRDKAERMAKLGQKKMNRMARAGEADRHTTASLEKHLVRFFPRLFFRRNFLLTPLSLVLWKAWYGQDRSSLEAPLMTMRLKRDPFLIIVHWF